MRQTANISLLTLNLPGRDVHLATWVEGFEFPLGIVKSFARLKVPLLWKSLCAISNNGTLLLCPGQWSQQAASSLFCGSAGKPHENGHT